jgi:uncharacterized membrane protein
MRLDEKIQTVIMIALLALGILTAAPVILGDRVVEPFSELGILGPNMKLGDYPREIPSGENIDLYLYLGNHEGTIIYYRVQVKLGDQSTNVSDTMPYQGEILSTYERVLDDENNCTIPISISLIETGINKRIVFELYEFKSEIREFEYEGNWVQLWVNVTEPR